MKKSIIIAAILAGSSQLLAATSAEDGTAMNKKFGAAMEAKFENMGYGSAPATIIMLAINLNAMVSEQKHGSFLLAAFCSDQAGMSEKQK